MDPGNSHPCIWVLPGIQQRRYPMQNSLPASLLKKRATEQEISSVQDPGRTWPMGYLYSFHTERGRKQEKLPMSAQWVHMSLFFLKKFPFLMVERITWNCPVQNVLSQLFWGRSHLSPSLLWDNYSSLSPIKSYHIWTTGWYSPWGVVDQGLWTVFGVVIRSEFFIG